MSNEFKPCAGLRGVMPSSSNQYLSAAFSELSRQSQIYALPRPPTMQARHMTPCISSKALGRRSVRLHWFRTARRCEITSRCPRSRSRWCIGGTLDHLCAHQIDSAGQLPSFAAKEQLATGTRAGKIWHMATIPDRNEILDRLRTVLPDKVGIDPALLQMDARLADIGIDSFSLIELVFLAEEEFSVSIPFEGLAVKTVSDVLDVIHQRIAVAAT